MKRKQGYIINIEAEKDQHFLAKKALRIIWLTGFVCIAIIFIFFINLSATSAKNDTIVTDNTNNEINSIDQLLLTSDESLADDNKSFVNGALRFQERTALQNLNQEQSRATLYNNILKRKLQRLPRARVSDFSIKPVPK